MPAARIALHHQAVSVPVPQEFDLQPLRLPAGFEEVAQIEPREDVRLAGGLGFGHPVDQRGQYLIGDRRVLLAVDDRPAHGLHARQYRGVRDQQRQSIFGDLLDVVAGRRRIPRIRIPPWQRLGVPDGERPLDQGLLEHLIPWVGRNRLRSQ